MIYGNPISLLCRCICRLNFRSRFAWSRGICINNVNAAAAAAKSLQSCPTLCDPIDGSPPGSLSLGFSRKEHWSGLPFPSPMHESDSEVAQSCLTLSDPMDCSLPGSSIHGIFQARVLKWGAIAFSNNVNRFSKLCSPPMYACICAKSLSCV